MTKSKRYLVLTPIGLVLLIGAWQGLRYWWYRGISRGTITGTIRKLAREGSPVCRYLAGELVVIGSNNAPAQQPLVWSFTTDDGNIDGPVASKLREAQTQKKPVTLSYRQDKGKWWACASTEYYVTGVE